ncbi:hypothetical protein ACHAWF_011125 [Thalassiosira exigua]
MICSPTSMPMLLALTTAAMVMVDLSAGVGAVSSSVMDIIIDPPLAADLNLHQFMMELSPSEEEDDMDESDSYGIFNASQNDMLSLSEGKMSGNDRAEVAPAGSYSGDFFNSSVVVEDGMDFPAEPAALIASASRTPALEESILHNQAKLESTTEVRYHPTYSDGELCSSKSKSSFESWEESYATLEDCCAVAFFWDFDACMMS